MLRTRRRHGSGWANARPTQRRRQVRLLPLVRGRCPATLDSRFAQMTCVIGFEGDVTLKELISGRPSATNRKDSKLSALPGVARARGAVDWRPADHHTPSNRRTASFSLAAADQGRTQAHRRQLPPKDAAHQRKGAPSAPRPARDCVLDRPPGHAQPDTGPRRHGPAARRHEAWRRAQRPGQDLPPSRRPRRDPSTPEQLYPRRQGESRDAPLRARGGRAADEPAWRSQRARRSCGKRKNSRSEGTVGRMMMNHAQERMHPHSGNTSHQSHRPNSATTPWALARRGRSCGVPRGPVGHSARGTRRSR